MWCDAHIHLTESTFPNFTEEYFCVSSCHSSQEFESLGRSTSLRLLSCVPGFADAHSSVRQGSLQNSGLPYTTAFTSFGIHPQMKAAGLYSQNIKSTLQELVENKKIIAIGECGFDFFTPEFKATEQWQTEVFEFQLELALKYRLPLVLHLRKSVHKVFEYKKQLSKVPSVIFHSFPGTVAEAVSILNNKINAYFSFGKPILNGKKSAIDCTKNLPLERILLETDAPYQTLKDEKTTPPEDIIKVYQKCASLRSMSIEELKKQISENFFKAYNITFIASS
ncbi:MAG: TatD family hydrolase [Treponema sp.]|nr:TatD family hydrolase [Candidatus Treponema equifaecale]